MEEKAGAAVDSKTFSQICVVSEVPEMARKDQKSQKTASKGQDRTDKQ